MKAAALILALAFVAGCHARSVRQADPTSTSFTTSVDRFWQYVNELGQNADGLVENLKAVQISNQFDSLISDTMAELSKYAKEARSQLPEAVTPDRLTEDLQLLANRLQRDMVDAKERSASYLNELKSVVDQNSEDVRSSLRAYSNKLKKRLEKDTAEIQTTVETYMSELQSRASQNMQVVKENVEPYVRQAGDSATQRLQDITTLLESQAQNIRTQLEGGMKDLSTSMDGKLEELTELIAPYATKIREHVENVMQQVKEATA